ncbi:B-cell receptor-associated 31 [Tubulinosema ratisbonensis]|uniref:B-cell receptor-associated 31 n=1 Tax=Tubulinosema ratisbonensis TaxID=291195 RepID=A0A437AMY3_9MICR|nr:B-cell receptor-associated 31 [Tubulinosema ratisbonensis]
MSITTNLVKGIALTQTLVFIYFLLPLKKSFKYKFLSVVKSEYIRPLHKVILAIYTMILLFFMDSVYRINTFEDIILKYYHKANTYLTGFTLFNGVILYRFLQIYNDTMQEEERTLILKKQCINQKEFVDKILKEVEDKKEEINKLTDEVKRYEVLNKQKTNNQKAYFDLLDKYNALKEITEPKKKK